MYFGICQGSNFQGSPIKSDNKSLFLFLQLWISAVVTQSLLITVIFQYHISF